MSNEVEDAPTYRIGTMDDPKVTEFLNKAKKARAIDSALSAWHMDIYAKTDGLIELPWDHTERWINVTTTDEIRDEETGKWTWPVSEQKTLAKLAAVAQYASKREGVTVEKKYDSTDFELHVSIPVKMSGTVDETITIRYYAKREVVCTKKVVGTKVIPAQVYAERVEEVIEWECQPVSLLGFDVNDVS